MIMNEQLNQLNQLNETEIYNAKLKSMLFRIIGLESKNLRTKELSEKEIKEKIREIIEEEVQCK